MSANEECSWCGRAVEPDDGYRAYEVPGARRAVFCRLEHVVPWAMTGPKWGAGEVDQAESVAEAPETCVSCGAELGEVAVFLIRHRGEFRIPDGFCSTEHMADWANAGGRWG